MEQEKKELIAQESGYGFSREQIELVKLQIAKGATDDELKIFLWTCQRLGLDPLSRQVYLIPRWDSKLGHEVKSPMVSIDGFRATAAKTEEHAGTDDAQFEESNGQPVKATVIVYRYVKGERCPFTATARWSEYFQEKSPLWKKMPFTMLGKCAEALALRKAFPTQLSGVYAPEEMDQSEHVTTAKELPKVEDYAKPAEKFEEPFPDKPEEMKELLCDVAGCGGVMKLRDGVKGKFYGCSHFPTCKNTKNAV